MKPVHGSIEIDRPPQDVFTYATDFATFPAWQVGAVSATRLDQLPVRPGSTAAVTRTVGPARLARTETLIRYHPPRTWSVEGRGGPLTASVHGTIEPLRDGAASRIRMDLDFTGRGVGKFFIPRFARRAARKQLPRNLQNLKDILEHGG